MENENEKPVYGQNDNIEFKSPKPNKAVTVIIYLLMLTLGTSLIILALIGQACKNQDEYLACAEVLQITSNEGLSGYSSDILFKTYSSYGLGSFIGYLIMTAGCFWFTRDEFYKDFNKLKKRPKYYLISTLICVVAFMVITIVFEMLWSYVVNDSANQWMIEAIIKYGGYGGVLLMIETVLFAPIVEELIYRKLIFSVLGKWSKISAYIVSILVFALVHMTSTEFDSKWFLILIPYLLCATLLAIIFERNDQNIFVSIAVHMINNLTACILLFI